MIQKALNENEFEYRVINNMKVLEEDLIKYACDVLGITNTLGRKVVSKSRLYEPLVIKNVELLSIVQDRQLTSFEVDKYLLDSSCVSFNYLYHYILLGEGQYKKVIAIINKYQNSIYVLCNFIIDKLENDIYLLLLFKSLKNLNCVEFIMKGCKLWIKN